MLSAGYGLVRKKPSYDPKCGKCTLLIRCVFAGAMNRIRGRPQGYQGMELSEADDL